MSKATLPLQEQKVRHKMYKTHKGWMVAGMATVSMALPMVVMTAKASADSVPVPTNSSVTTPTTDSTAVTTATGTAQNGNGQNVEVPHQNLDSAVNQANQTGVRVTQNQTTSQTVTADQSQQAQANIANDYNQQTQKVNEATKAQDWKNTTYKSDQADANQVNANNQAKINQAVQNARQEGVNAYHDTANDTTQTANIGRYDNSDYEAKKQDVNQKTNETVAKLNEVTAKAHANNMVANASNDHSTLDQTVQDARSKGFTVNQEATRNVGGVTTANADQLANSIRQDYQNQNDALTLAISQYYAKAQQNLGTTDVEGFLHSLWEARRSYAVNHGNVGMTGSGSWTNFAIDNYDGMSITPRGTVHSLSDLKNGNFQVIVEHATPSKVVKYVEWGNVTPQLISGELNAGIGRDNQGDYDQYPTQKDNGTRTQTWNVTPGTKFRIPGAVHMANGDVKDLIVTVRQSGNKLNSNHITVYNQDGAVNFSSVGSGYNNNNRIDLEFWINNENDHTDYLWVTTIADIDVKQKFSYGSTQIIGLGGLVSVHDGVIQGSDGADLNGPSSAPNGMTVLSLHENHFWMALQDDGGSAYYPMIAVFGRAGNVEPTIIPDKPTLAYHYNDFGRIQFNQSDSAYSTTNLAVNTPTPETANYTLHNLTVTAQAKKGATQVNDNSDVIADGHKLLAGDALTYNIDVKDNSLPANRTDNTTSFTFTDTLPSAFTLDSYSISNGNDGGDVTQLFNYIYDPATRKFTATAKKPFLDLINQDKTKAYILPSLHLNGRVNASSATLRNQADVLINGVKTSTNTVTNTSTDSNPSKSVNVSGQDANGKTTITNDVQNFDVTFDLTDYTNTTASDAIKSRGIKFTDDMTITNNAVSLNQGSIKLVDAHGNSVNGYTLNVNPTNSGYQLVVNVNNAKDFLNTYGGQKLHLKYTAKTNDGVTGSVRNVATENIYGSTYTTNTVITNVKDINPTKDIVVNAGDNRSIDGNTVPINSTYNYKLNSSELPANRVSVITNWGISDNVDTNHVQLTGAWRVVNNHGFTDEQGHIINAGTDITSYFDYHVGDNGNIQITPKASFLALMNKAENKTFEQSWSAYVQVKVIKAGWVTNTFNENLNDDHDKSNEVKTFSFDPVTPDPDKNGTIGKSDSVTYISVNNKKVTKGDTVSYVLKGQDLQQYHEVINRFEATDTFDNGLSYIGYKAYLNNKDGSRVDVTNHLTQNTNGQQVTWVADAQLIKMLNSDEYNTRPGVAPTIYAFVKVLTDNNQNIDNTYELNINGKTRLSQNVRIVPTTSTLDKNESVAGKDSNGKTVIANDRINFTLPWDLTNLNPQTTAISAEQMAKGLSVTDKMTTTVPNLTPFNQGTRVSISDASGHAVDSNLYTINYDSDGLGFNVQVKDVARFLQAYGGQRLNLTYSITTPDGVSGTFNNQATQNEFGNITKTKVVQNNVKDINPTKDVVVNAGQNISINGETVDYNSNINYKLNSSELPANRATVVTNWSTTDGLDTRHVDPTGNWHVYTNTDFVDNHGNTINANTDISRYFNYNYNNKTGVVTVTPTNEYLQIMNNASNVKTAQSWSAYVQTKVIGSGWAYNSFDENLNNDLDHSNQVKTFSYEPVVPKPNKDATIGQSVSNNPISINGKGVTKGDTISYELKGQTLPQYHDTINTFSAFDVFDTGIQYIGFKAFMNMPDGTRKDVSSMIKADVDGNTVAFVANNELINLMNSDKYNTNASVTPTIYAFAKVTSDGIKEINNSYFLNINGKQDVSNIVTNKTVTSDPDKKETVAGIDSNGKTVITNDRIDYKVTWDLSQLDPNKIAVSDEQMAKGLDFEDVLQSDTPNTFQKGPVAIEVTDAKGKAVNVGIRLNDSEDGSSKRFVSDISNPREFLKQYGGQKLTITYSIPVQDRVNAHISNTFIQKNFGNIYTAPVVRNTIKDINPTKDIVVNAGENHSINGNTVPLNSTYNYKLNSSELPTNRATVVTNWTTYDQVDTNHVSLTGNWQVQNNKDFVDANGRTIKAGSNISNYFTYQASEDGSVRITPKAEFLSIMNQANNKATAQSWSAYVQVKVVKAGWVTNTFNENLNDDHDKSNEVKTFSFDPVTPDPNKNGTIGKSDSVTYTSVNNKKVTKGDTVSYVLKGQDLKQYHEVINQFEATDTFDNGLSYIGYKAYLNNKDGSRVDVTSHLTQKVNGQQVTWVADAQLIKMLNSDAYNTKPGVAPTIYAFAKVLTDNNQAINNTYQLNINGKTKLSQNVKIVPTTSTLDKNESVAGKDSNDKTVITNDLINFTLPWDLTNLNSQTTAVSAEQMAKGLSVTDKMTTNVPNLAPFKQGTKVSISDASGHAVDSNLYTINYDSDGLGFNVQVKDVTKFLKAYGGQRLNLTYSIKTPDGVSGAFNNQATQNEFGNITKTKVVQNNVKDINPTKDVVVNAGETVSINGETVDYNSNINYKLNSSELPANRATVVTNWSTTDRIDTKHVKPTGNWHVYANTDFVDNQGNTIKAKTDISRYFNFNYDDKTGIVTVTPTNEYLQIMNNASNVKTAQSWSAYVQTKVIGSGWAYNSFDEDLNNDLDHSNQVKTFSYEPVVPKPNKDATIGQSVSNNPISINGKGVTKGDTISYELKGQALPQYHDTINTFSAFDVFDTGIQYIGFKAFMNMPDGTRKDVSNMIETDVDGNTVAFVANKELINLMNSDKYNTKASVTPTIYAFAKVTADGIEKISNSYFLNINGKQDVSNIVTNKTVTSDPDKKETVAGIDSNGKTVITNDRIDYKVTWDLSQLDPNKIAVSDEQMAKGLGFEDILQSDKANTFQKGPVTIKVTDAKGKAVNVGIRLNDSNDGSSKRFVSEINNPREFLKQYGGQKLTITYSIPVQDGVNAHISNTFIQKNFGNIYTAPVVRNTVKDINPTKDIVINAGENHSINGNTVPLNSTYNYKLNSSELPANRATVVTNWTTYDRVDTNHVSLTGNWQVQNDKDFVNANGKTIKAGSNISNYFTYQADKDGSVRITPKAEFLSIMNQANNKGTAQSWSAYVQVKVIKAGWVTNTFNENLNDDHDKSNEVKTFSFDPVTPDPNKNGTIGKSDSVTYTSVNNKKVTKGDTVSYVLKGQDLKQYHEVINRFEATDTFDKGLSYIGYKAYLNNKDGSRVDVTSHLTQKVNGQQVTWVADAQLIKMLNSDAYNTKPGVAPTIYAFAKVLTDNNQSINNVYELNINGKTKLSQNVKIVPTTSTLDKNEKVAGKDSNGKTVITNDLINFTLPWDLTNLNPQTTAISAEQMAKGLSITDKMTTNVPNLAPFKQGTKVSISDASGHAVDSSLYTINYDSDGLGFNVQVKDVAKFLKAYGGQRLNLTYSIKTPDSVSGTFNNQATQNEFGNITKTKVVQNSVKDINPTKDVVVNAGENVSINGETVDLKSDYNYKLNSSTLPANRATVVTNWSATDKLDTTHVAPTGNWKVFANTDFVDGKGNTLKARADISQYFTYSLKDSVVTVTPKKEFLDMMNLDANKGKEQSWSAYVQVKVIKSGWATNTFNENLNNDIDKSNEVKTFSFEPVVPKPNKDATIGQSVSNKPVSINGKGVTKGDTISYELKGQALPQYHDTIHTFSAFDVFDTGIQYTGFKAFMNMPDGTRKDVSSMIKADVDGNTVAFVANNELINLMNSDKYNTKASVTPTIYAFAKVTADGIKEINNSYFLNINGKQDVSNIVTNKTVTSDPDKKETVAGIDSNGKTVITNDRIDYKVTWDLSQLDPNKIAVSDEQMAKGLDFEDILQSDKANTFQKGPVTIKVTDAKGKAVNVGIRLNDSNDGLSKRFVSDISNPREFLKQYGGQKLTITYSIPVQDGVNAHISNTFIQKNFGNIYTAPVVRNTIKDINPTKDIVINAGENHSINGNTVPLNSTYNYKLNSSELPANRATVVNNWTTYDRVDTNHVSLTGNWQVQNNKDFVDANGKTIKAGSNISNYFTYQADKNGSVRITPKAEFLSIMNQTNNKGTAQSWSAYVQVKVIKAGWVTNTFNENLNDDHDKSNEVKTFSFEPVKPDPKKDVALGETTSPNAQSINGALVAPGDNLSYELKGQPLPQYHEQIKSFTATDVFDKGVTYNGFKAFLNVTDANGKVTQIDVTNYLKEEKSGNSVVWTATEQLLKLLNSDAYNTKASVTPTIYAKVTVDKDKAETIDNTYFVNINNKQGQSNVVENKSTTPDPTKGDYDTDGNDIDGKNVLAQSQNEYQLNWNNAKYKGVVASDNAIKKGFYYVDDVQDDALDIIDGSFKVTDEQGNEVKGVSAHVYDSISDVPDDVSDMLKANNLTPQGKFVVYSADDPQAFFKDYVQKGINLKLSFKVSSKVDFNGEYKNKAYQVNFGQAYETNEVTNKVIKTTPTKEVKNGFGEDINGKTIARGDVLAYEVKLDLTDFVNYSLTKDQLAKGLSVSDDYDETKLNITDANKAGFIVLDKDGKAVDNDMFDLTWNDEKGAWTLNVKDPQTFLKQYGGQKLAILFFATAKKDVTGDIYNKAIQNSFGQIVETNTVVNHISEMNPHKDAVISVDKQGSLDNHEIALGDTFNYKLDSSIRPANYGGITSEWSYTDKLDIEHDQYQGQFKVYAKRDFQLADGTLIKGGSDISKFFTATYDTQTGEFKVSANQDFLAIMNLDVNKATEQGWVAYVNVKRIKSGEVHNTAEESYNHEVLKTNTVTTTTPEPPAPKQPVVPQVPTSPKETPKVTPTVTPTVPTSYQAPAVKTPAPVANETALPQTGQSDDTILAILGITLGTIGTMTLAGAKKKRGSSFVIKED